MPWTSEAPISLARLHRAGRKAAPPRSRIVQTGAAFLAAALSGACGQGAPHASWLETKPFAVAGFGGVLLDNNYEDVLVPGRLEVENSYLLGVAGSVRAARPLESHDIEVEAQLVRHFHGQNHWEFNGPIITGRWTAFPGDEYLDTSAAFGLGLSVASETPRLELRNVGESRPLMTYWMFELAADLPPEDLELIARIHHRSTAYGTFGDDGGANALVMGLRHRF